MKAEGTVGAPTCSSYFSLICSSAASEERERREERERERERESEREKQEEDVRMINWIEYIFLFFGLLIHLIQISNLSAIIFL
jgi:hypothetical protein